MRASVPDHVSRSAAALTACSLFNCLPFAGLQFAGLLAVTALLVSGWQQTAFAQDTATADAAVADADVMRWVTYDGKEGSGAGKHIVLLAGDEEYRSEESMPQLGQILAERHGFKCTVLFSQDDNGTIDPENQTNIPGLEVVADADLLVMAWRFRELPDEDMKYIDDYVNSGKPILALRTSTHAFAYSRNKQSPYAYYSYDSKEKWIGGFGQHVLGETWVSHHGEHKIEGFRGVINAEQKDNPILRGVSDVFGPTDVYGVIHLPEDATVLLYGQVVDGIKPDAKPVEGKKNDPMMPLLWTRPWTGSEGKASRIICTTMGASSDMEYEGTRRVLVNSIFWGLGMEAEIAESTNVDIVGEFKPTFFGFGEFETGVKVSRYAPK